MLIRLFPMFCIGLLLTSGCVTNYYEDHYADLNDPLARHCPPPSSEQVKIRPVLSKDDLISTIEKGYLPIGECSFVAPHAPWHQAVDVAREKGCDLVLIDEVFQTEKKYTSVLHVPTTDFYHSYDHAYYYDRWGRPHYGHYLSSTTVHGTQVVPYTRLVKQYNQTAMFLRKADFSNLYGVFISVPPRLPGTDLNEPCQATVLAVVQGSQAEKDGIRRSAKIQSLNGKQIKNRHDLMPFLADLRTINSVEVCK